MVEFDPSQNPSESLFTGREGVTRPTFRILGSPAYLGNGSG